MGISLAILFIEFVDYTNLPLFERLIREANYKDIADPIGKDVLGYMIRKNPKFVFMTLDKWIVDENIWIRRATILSQFKLKKESISKKVIEYCKILLDDQNKYV